MIWGDKQQLSQLESANDQQSKKSMFGAIDILNPQIDLYDGLDAYLNANFKR